MNKRLIYSVGTLLLAVLVAALVYQGSISLGVDGPISPQLPYLLWAVAITILLLAVTVGFMLFRDLVKLYVARRSNREGSRIHTKLVLGALGLTIMPVCFLMFFSLSVLGHNLDKWFSRPTDNVARNLLDVSRAFEGETQRRADAQARWLAALPEVSGYAITGQGAESLALSLCQENGIAEAWLEAESGRGATLCEAEQAEGESNRLMTARAPISGAAASVVAQVRMPADLAERQGQIASEIATFAELAANRREFRALNLLLMVLISLFVLFAATWTALFLARQITGPISALVEAAGELRKGRLSHRIHTTGMDELGALIRAFNAMAEDIETSEGELERRRQFTEAILESVPSGVITLSREKDIQRVNRAFSRMFGEERAARAKRLDDLFPDEEVRELRYLLNRVQRTGLASTQIDFPGGEGRTMHLSVTASALEGKAASGYLLVVEDTSELLRAQKAVAWHEVARRVAHEIKNPLTPIALSAQRIARQLERLPARSLPADTDRILRECSLTISAEVETVRTLVDEFSQFARFPAAQPVPADLNESVEGALAVFAGRLDGVVVRKDLAAELPLVSIDREQFKRVLVNLIDNAAEAMQDSLHRELLVQTHWAAPESVVLVVSDTGHGISPEDRDRLFLPYFSTRNRGTGLGLAIVHHIVTEHGAAIRVEDHKPTGARFVIEIPVPGDERKRAEASPTETVA